MEMYGFSFKNVKPYLISNRNVESCDIYHDGVYVARYACPPAKNGEEPNARIFYACPEAKREMHDAIEEVLGEDATPSVVMDFLNKAFDIFRYEFMVKSLRRKGQGDGVLVFKAKDNPEQTVAIVAMTRTDIVSVNTAKEAYGYLGYGSTELYSRPEDFVVA